MGRLMGITEMRLERLRNAVTLQALSTRSGLSMTRLADAELGRVQLSPDESRARTQAIRQLAKKVAP